MRDDKERKAQYYQDNKEHIIKCHKQWQEDNKEYYKQYYLNNKEFCLKYSKKWQQDNRKHSNKWYKKYRNTIAGKASEKAKAHNRRILTRGLTKAIIQRVYEANIVKYGQLTCILCFKPIEFGDDSLEHLTPLSRGGSNDFSNLGIAHLKCNIRKGTMTLKEWVGDSSAQVPLI